MTVVNFKSWAARRSNTDNAAFRWFLREVRNYANCHGFRFDNFSFRRNFNKFGDVNSVTVYFKGGYCVDEV